MKPSHTPLSTATLPIRLASRIAVATTGLDVAAPRTTSSRRMTLAGEKKWRPTTHSGRLVAAAMRLRSRKEVLRSEEHTSELQSLMLTTYDHPLALHAAPQISGRRAEPADGWR